MKVQIRDFTFRLCLGNIYDEIKHPIYKHCVFDAVPGLNEAFWYNMRIEMLRSSHHNALQSHISHRLERYEFRKD